MNPGIDVADTTVQDVEGNFLQTNEYYVRHPERMLGEIADDKLYPGRLALVADGRDISQAMQETFAQFPQQIYQKRTYQAEPDTNLRVKLPPDTTVKNFGYLAQGGHHLATPRGLARAYGFQGQTSGTD